MNKSCNNVDFAVDILENLQVRISKPFTIHPFFPSSAETSLHKGPEDVVRIRLAIMTRVNLLCWMDNH